MPNMPSVVSAIAEAIRDGSPAEAACYAHAASARAAHGGRWPLWGRAQTQLLLMLRCGRGNAVRFLFRPDMGSICSHSGKLTASEAVKPLVSKAC